jgi:hypothetical protein
MQLRVYLASHSENEKVIFNIVKYDSKFIAEDMNKALNKSIIMVRLKNNPI